MAGTCVENSRTMEIIRLAIRKINAWRRIFGNRVTGGLGFSRQKKNWAAFWAKIAQNAFGLNGDFNVIRVMGMSEENARTDSCQSIQSSMNHSSDKQPFQAIFA
jgi:hypothetical protein